MQVCGPLHGLNEDRSPFGYQLPAQLQRRRTGSMVPPGLSGFSLPGYLGLWGDHASASGEGTEA